MVTQQAFDKGYLPWYANMVSFLSAENNFEIGDLIEISRGLYSHWAVYSGK